MTSESESKEETEPILGFSGRRIGAILGLLFVLLAAWSIFVDKPDQVVLSRSVYEDLLRALDQEADLKTKGILRRPGGAGGAVAAQAPPAPPPAVPGGDNCDVEKIRLGFDARFDPKSQEIRLRLKNTHYPTFEQLYKIVVNKDYSPSSNIWTTFPNAYGLKANFHFPFSNLQPTHVEQVLATLGRDPRLMVEVGSFHGHSTIVQAAVVDQRKLGDVPLVCIDPFTGDLGMLLYRDDWDHKLTPGEIADGRSTSYWQFMLNVKSQMDAGKIGPKHVVPVVATSILGARFLMAIGATPDTIFLDSAHEVDETYSELTLFYHTLAPGGIIFGDDFTWEGVAHDVKRFAAKMGVELKTSGVIWFIQKPPNV